MAWEFIAVSNAALKGRTPLIIIIRTVSEVLMVHVWYISTSENKDTSLVRTPFFLGGGGGGGGAQWCPQ